MNILVTGKNGQLGSELQLLAKHSDHIWFFEDRSGLDILNTEAIQNYFRAKQVDVCINCAAYTAVDKAEDEKKIAQESNSKALEKLAIECSKQNSLLIHISTDYVFDGKNYRPYLETDITNPINFYGQTKLDGEKLALRNNSKTIIIRTSWVYSSFGKNFVKTILNLADQKNELLIVSDQIGTPTNAKDLAEAILKMLQTQDLDDKLGLYHFSNLGVASWYDFAWEIVNMKNLDCQVKPILSKDFPTPAKRPFYSVMDKSKISSNFDIDISYWKISLQKLLKLF